MHQGVSLREEAKKAAGRMGGKSDRIHSGHTRAWKDLRAEIIGHFPGATNDDLGKGVLAGEERPGPQDAVTEIYALMAKNGASSVNGEVAKGMYDYLSNVTHPTLYPSRQITSWVEHPDNPGELFARLELAVGDVEKEMAVAVRAYYQVLSYVTSFYGWDRSVFDDFDAEVAKVLPHVFR